MTSYTQQLDASASTLNDQAKAQVANIQEVYQRRKDQMKLINQSTLAAQTKIGIRAGRQRYAPEIQTSILSAEESAGVARMADLDAEEQGLILEAQRANTSKQFEILDKKMGQLTSLQEKKVQLIQDQAKMALQQEQLAIQKAEEARSQLKFAREEEEAMAFSLASSAIGMDTEELKQFAQEKGVDFNLLQNAMNEVSLSQDKEKLALSKVNLEIARSLPSGSSWADPTTGLTFYGISEEEPEMIDIERVIGGQEFLVRYDLSGDQPKELFTISKGEIYKATGGITVGLSDKFWSETAKGVTELQSGEDWGTVWNRLKTRFPEISAATIDTALGEQWRKEGAFEEYKLKRASAPSQLAQTEASIWKDLAANPDLPSATKKQWIESMGFDPEDFNIY